ncbi:MAG: hypothetical protein AAFW74_09055, partial [Pseudomonadota bacterium]
RPSNQLSLLPSGKGFHLVEPVLAEARALAQTGSSYRLGRNPVGVVMKVDLTGAGKICQHY